MMESSLPIHRFRNVASKKIRTIKLKCAGEQWSWNKILRYIEVGIGRRSSGSTSCKNLWCDSPFTRSCRRCDSFMGCWFTCLCLTLIPVHFTVYEVHVRYFWVCITCHHLGNPFEKCRWMQEPSLSYQLQCLQCIRTTHRTFINYLVIASKNGLETFNRNFDHPKD